MHQPFTNTLPNHLQTRFAPQIAAKIVFNIARKPIRSVQGELFINISGGHLIITTVFL